MKTILVAEDNESNYILMYYILRNHYQVVHAKDGQEAVEMAKRDDIDLILMDIKMPVMNGHEATAKIKETRPALPIIALTANAFDSDRKMALDVGCDDFIAKPVNAAQCLEIIAKYIGE